MAPPQGLPAHLLQALFQADLPLQLLAQTSVFSFQEIDFLLERRLKQREFNLVLGFQSQDPGRHHRVHIRRRVPLSPQMHGGKVCNRGGGREDGQMRPARTPTPTGTGPCLRMPQREDRQVLNTQASWVSGLQGLCPHHAPRQLREPGPRQALTSGAHRTLILPACLLSSSRMRQRRPQGCAQRAHRASRRPPAHGIRVQLRTHSPRQHDPRPPPSTTPLG